MKSKSRVKEWKSTRVKYENEFLDQRWAILFNNFIKPFYDYNDKCKEKGEPTNFRVLSDDLFLPLLQQAMEIRNVIGFDEFGSEDQVALATKIRKKIYEVEMYSVQYAQNIKYYFDEYFDENCQSLKGLKSITKKISQKLIA